MSQKNRYPVVLLHGMFGYGQQQITTNKVPYFGLWVKDIRVMFNEMGIPCVAPSMGPFTSAWNRACEVYAQLFGGTVDYGKAHAAKYGMERFGATYDTPLLPQWGTLDENGELIKVNIIGHSFGGVTGRLLTELMVNGSAEERAATDPDDLSPLFQGGHKGWVHSITTLASPHNGASCLEGKVGVVMRHICRGICDVFNFVDVTPARAIYNIGLGMYGLTPEKGDFKNVWKDQGYKKYMFEMEDTIIADLTYEGAHALNDRLPEQPDVYYFSHRGYRSFPTLFGNQLPSPKAFPLINILGFFMGRQSVPDLPDKSWRRNDMVINTISGEAPDGAKRKDLKDGKLPRSLKPATWYVYPAEWKDHMSFLGWTMKKEAIGDYYKDLYEAASSAPTIQP